MLLTWILTEAKILAHPSASILEKQIRTLPTVAVWKSRTMLGVILDGLASTWVYSQASLAVLHDENHIYWILA